MKIEIEENGMRIVVKKSYFFSEGDVYLGEIYENQSPVFRTSMHKALDECIKCLVSFLNEQKAIYESKIACINAIAEKTEKIHE